MKTPHATIRTASATIESVPARPNTIGRSADATIGSWACCSQRSSLASSSTFRVRSPSRRRVSVVPTIASSSSGVMSVPRSG